MATHTETLQVSGIRCERCVMRLGGVLERVEGIESANASLMGQVSVSWNDETVSRDAIVRALEGGGFPVLVDA